MRPVRFGDVLSDAITLYTGQLRPLLAISAAFWLPLGALELLFLHWDALEAETPTDDGTATVNYGLLGTTLAAIAVAAPLTVAAVTEFERRRRERGPDGAVRHALAETIGRGGVVVGAWLLATLGTFAGLVLLVVPGLFLAVRWSIVIPVVAVERVAAGQALGRSWQLVRGSGWPVFGLVLLGGAVTAGVAYALGRALASSPAGASVASTLASLVASPFAAALAAALYFRLSYDAVREDSDGAGRPG